MKKTTELSNYHYYFTEDGYYAERKPEADLNPEMDRQFTEDRYKVLYLAGFEECPAELDATGRFLFHTAALFIDELTRQPDIELQREELTIIPTDDLRERIYRALPFVYQSDFVNDAWIDTVFKKLNAVFQEEVRFYFGSMAMYFAEKNNNLTIPERIFFHLVESKETEYPFAFLATYGTQSENGKVKHVPLSYALKEYEYSNEKLLELLSCLNRVAEVSTLISEFVERGEMFHPIGLTAEEAYSLLTDYEKIEAAGIIFRIPNWWKRNAANVSMNVTLGEEKPVYLGLDTLLTMAPSLAVDGVSLTREDIEALLAETEGLSLIKGKWVVVNHEKLRALLKEMEQYEGNITLLEALRGSLDAEVKAGSVDVNGVITNGQWLKDMLSKIKNPEKLRKTVLPSTFKATLRKYQHEGYEWLKNMGNLGFGACLADDMGLGKTVQVLAYLESFRKKNQSAHVLLVAPASLLGNWQKEAEKFVPAMPVAILHGMGREALCERLQNEKQLPFLSVTTYGMVARMEEFSTIFWNVLVLDEAQAIKNPGTKQTRAVKKLQAGFRIALTGTPIENELANLWSLFDFLDKGLLGSSTEFGEFAKNLSKDPQGYSKLRGMIAPFMLRRMKTDKRIISDLPDKIETVDYISLSKKQTVLYRKYVVDLQKKIEESEGLARRGIILGALTRFKQLCNHPDEFLGQEAYEMKDSGKFERLKELCEIIKSKRERVLVFTQFKELTPYLDEFLCHVFGRKGFVLHGGTPVGKRNEMVEAFQGEYYIPYMVISVKAGGTGLNLTNANHVIHFDRWWNPAVENQATDRAFRIGQKKKVIVHKLVCKGTIEEKIDAMLFDKAKLAENVVGESGESWITKLSNEELFRMLRLEI